MKCTGCTHSVEGWGRSISRGHRLGKMISDVAKQEKQSSRKQRGSALGQVCARLLCIFNHPMPDRSSLPCQEPGGSGKDRRGARRFVFKKHGAEIYFEFCKTRGRRAYLPPSISSLWPFPFPLKLASQPHSPCRPPAPGLAGLTKVSGQDPSSCVQDHSLPCPLPAPGLPRASRPSLGEAGSQPS